MINTLQNFCTSKDRGSFIYNSLKKSGIKVDEQKYQGGVNYSVSFGESPNLILGAHYDCVSQSPGANDNGASIVELMELAKILNEIKCKNNITIVFFDHEEYLAGGPIDEMGSHYYGENLKREKTKPDLFLVLDVCGVGDTFVISDSSSVLQSDFLKNHLSERFVFVESSTPPSDNFALGRSDVDSVLLTMLPYQEAFSNEYPRTWSFLHTPDDHPKFMSEDTMYLVTDMLLDLSYLFNKEKVYNG